MRTKDKNNLEFIKEKAEREKLTVPDSLNSENIKRLLENENIKNDTVTKITVSKSKTFKSIVSVAACAAIALTAISANLVFGKNSLYTTKIDDKDGSAQSVVTTNGSFKSYDELILTINKIKQNQKYDAESATRFFITDYYYTSADTAAGNESAKSSTSHEQTYNQVDGVDEGDIIKNDGKYIYIADKINKKIAIFETNNGNSSLVSSIKYNDLVEDMYLYDDKIAVISNKEDKKTEYTECVVYDVSKKDQPKKLSRLSQDGYYLSSRVVGNQLYLITNKYADIYEDDTTYQDLIPHVLYEKEDENKNISQNNGALDIKDICSVEKPNDLNYVIVSSLNMENGENVTDQKAVLGAGDNVYCTTDNLYVMNEDYSANIEKTHIMKFSLKNGDIDLTAESAVNGSAINQYSFDEKDGNLRIATTYFKNGTECNTVFVLDDNLNILGNSGKFAKDETIQAVRYIGDTAYVITYEQTDPLFVIDLSDPKEPQIKGSVKIEGFSSMLHPVDENTLIGIGYADEETAEGEWIDGVKIVLFDISDSSNPKVLDSKIFKDTYSEAQYNPKAFMVNDDQGYYAIPINYDFYIDYDDDENYETGNHLYDKSETKTFKIENNKINITNDFVTSKDYSSERCTYIGDYVYVIAFNYEDGYKLESFKYSDDDSNSNNIVSENRLPENEESEIDSSSIDDSSLNDSETSETESSKEISDSYENSEEGSYEKEDSNAD